MHHFTQALIITLIVTFMFQAGLKTPPGTLRLVPKATLLRGLVTLLVLSPLLALALSALFAPPPEARVAIVLLSVVGVMPLAARGATKAHGTTASAVVLTVVVGFVAIFTAVPSARAMFSYTGHLHFRAWPELTKLLLLQAVPLVVGLIVRRWRRDGTARLEKLVGTVNVVVLAVVAVALIATRATSVTALGARGTLAVIAFAVGIAALAYLFGGKNAGERRALIGIVNTPNVGLALAIVASVPNGKALTAPLFGAFLLRFVVGAALDKFAGRRATREELAARADGLATGHPPVQST